MTAPLKFKRSVVPQITRIISSKELVTLLLPEHQQYFSKRDIERLLGVNDHIVRQFVRDFDLRKHKRGKAGKYMRSSLTRIIKNRFRKCMYCGQGFFDNSKNGVLRICDDYTCVAKHLHYYPNKTPAPRNLDEFPLERIPCEVCRQYPEKPLTIKNPVCDECQQAAQGLAGCLALINWEE